MQFLLGTPRAARRRSGRRSAIQPQSDELEHSAHTVLADADGFQRDRLPVRPPHRRGARSTTSRGSRRVSGRFDDLKFFGAVAPVSARRAGRVREGPRGRAPRTHIVAPPGSGKTLLGVELIRRVGKRALVLAPNQGIQQQWPRAVGEFTPNPRGDRRRGPAEADRLPLLPGAVPARGPRDRARARSPQSRWADERAAATGMTPEEADARGRGASRAPAADRRARELARISAALKREVARGEHAGVELRDLLSTTASERVQQLAKLGVGVVLLDECHHLASLWGYVVRAVLGELGEEVHVIGLTATPPIGLPGGRGRALRRAARARSTSPSPRPPSCATATSRPTRSWRG